MKTCRASGRFIVNDDIPIPIKRASAPSSAVRALGNQIIFLSSWSSTHSICLIYSCTQCLARQLLSRAQNLSNAQLHIKVEFFYYLVFYLWLPGECT